MSLPDEHVLNFALQGKLVTVLTPAKVEPGAYPGADDAWSELCTRVTDMLAGQPPHITMDVRMQLAKVGFSAARGR